MLPDPVPVDQMMLFVRRIGIASRSRLGHRGHAPSRDAVAGSAELQAVAWACATTAVLPVAVNESGFAMPDPADNNIIWSTGTGSGSIRRHSNPLRRAHAPEREVEVWPDYVAGAPAAEVKYRFNWEFPIAISPHDHNRCTWAASLCTSPPMAEIGWQIISPDLTRNDKSRQQISGGFDFPTTSAWNMPA